MGRFCGPVVRMRGLPWSATPQDIREFFNGLEISQDGIVLARNGDGRVTGEAYVLFSDEENFQRAMTRNREHIGKRYIELFKSSGEEMELALKRAIASPASQPRPKLPPNRQRLNSAHSVDFSRYHGDPTPLWEVTPTLSLPLQGIHGAFSSNPTSPILPALWMPDRVDEAWLKATQLAKKQEQSTPLPSTIMDCVQLRGLPYSATKHQIADFFSGLSMGEGGVHFIFDSTGRPTGNAYVHFGSVEDAVKATEKHKHHMGSRYIEVFRCPRIEMINAVGPFRFNIQQSSPASPWTPQAPLANGSALPHPDLLSPNAIFPSTPSFSPLVMPSTPGVSWEPTATELNNSAYALDQATQSLLKSQQSWSRVNNAYSPSSEHAAAAFVSPSKLKTDPISFLSPHLPQPIGQVPPVSATDQVSDIPIDLIRSLNQVRIQDTKSPGSLTSEQIADNLFSSLSGTLFGSDQFLSESLEQPGLASWSDGLSPATTSRGPDAFAPAPPSNRGGGGPDSGFTGLPQPPTNATHQKTMIRMRGIPYNTDKFEILNFFSGFSLTQNDIYICYNEELKPTGEAFVQFNTYEEAQKAIIEKDRKHIGPRYVELFVHK